MHSSRVSWFTEGGEWDPSSLAILSKVFKISEGNIATKIGGGETGENNLCTTTVMESGQHRISIKLMKGGAAGLRHLFGVVRDGRAWDAGLPESESTVAWYMDSGDSGR